MKDTRNCTLTCHILHVRPDELAHVDDLLIAAVRTGQKDVMECIADRIMEKRKLIDWKAR